MDAAPDIIWMTDRDGPRPPAKNWIGFPMTAFSGKRILLVEDEALVCMVLEDMLIDAGAVVVGPAGTLAQALALARTEAIDAAVLDVNMNGERSDAVAETLSARAIPFVFATGYGSAGIRGHGDVPVLEKPYGFDRLSEILRGLLAD